MKGWISINRAMKLNWVWEDKPFSKGQAWIDLLLSAQHTEKKLPTKTDFITLKRGELLTQERTLMNNWGWSKTKVRSFLKMLEKDLMIIRKKDQNKTVLSICNYNSYQDDETKKEPKKDQNKTKIKPKKDLCNNDNNANNEIIILIEALESDKFKILIRKWFDFRKELKKPIKTDAAIKSLINRSLKEGYDKSNWVINNSIDNEYQGLFWDNYNGQVLVPTESEDLTLEEKLKKLEQLEG